MRKSVIFILILISTSATAEVKFSEHLLEDAERIHVETVIDEDVEKFLSASRAETIIELELRRNGITVEENVDSAIVYLVFTVLAVVDYGYKNTVIRYSLAVTGEVLQPVSLVRDGEYAGMATTWSKLWVGLYGEGKIRSSLEQLAVEAAEEFANEYLAANPKASEN